MMMPPPPLTSTTLDDCVPSNEDTSSTTEATVSNSREKPELSHRHVDANKNDKAGAGDELEQPPVDSDGVAMEISDHLRNMGIIDGNDEGSNKKEHAGGEEGGGDRSNTMATTMSRRNFYSSWSDSDDTKWYMEMDENDQNNTTRC